MKIVLKNCRLIPALSDGYSGGCADVVLEGGTICQICPAGEAVQDEEVQCYDCGGKTLLPGLFDLHTHLNFDYYNGVIRLNDFKLLIRSCLSAKRFLNHGITTIRDMGAPKRLSVYVRQAIQSGLFPGPRIISGGMILCPQNRDTDADSNCFLRYISGVDDTIRAVREEIGGGADFVKLYAQGEPPELLPEEAQAAVRIAHLRGKKVAVHAHDASAVHMCLEAGVDTIEHGSFIQPEDIEALKAETSYLVPTLSILSPEVPTPGTAPAEKAALFRPLLEANGKNITAAYQAGLKLGFGTDTAIEDLEEHPGLEFKMRKELCGMENVDLLLQATKYSAMICGLEHITGEVKEGLAADLIVVDGNPDQDISVMYHKPELVFIGGTPHFPE